ncbi:metal-transporting ATPase [Mycolicibacterium neoaurum]|nr:metal ABC transporter ATPase [Mycolicibacterium neoaurum]AXK78091.1 cadmium-translocating P-type ATPase [Mycolicibacterium neoaurum]KUM05780.1 metal-transporting ATPase [Mycolicibacterium neoaurum]
MIGVERVERSIGAQRRRTAWSLESVRWAVGALMFFLAGLILQLGGAPEMVWWTAYLACYLAGGWQSAVDGLTALRRRRLDVDLLMVLAALGAAAIGQVFDGALLIVIFATSGALEDVATRRTEDSVRALLDLAPERAVRVDRGVETEVPVSELRVGDRILVRPGERVSADATVIEGASDVDQAGITGEPLPVAVHVGDEIFAGTLNGTGALAAEVVRDPSDSVVARIVAMVGQASATKARTQLFIEKIEQRYSMVMVGATLALFTVPLLFGADLRSALLRAMTFMIVASPCALVLATMPPLLSAIATAGRHGVLVKSAVVMERLATVQAVAFDKTGTLTTGRPRVVGEPPETVLALAAAAEQLSEHPLGRAIVAAARERALPIAPVTRFRALPGRGVSALVGGRRVEVVSPAALGGPAPESVAALESAGATAVVVTVDGECAGVIGLRDTVRQSAADVVADLHRCTGRVPLLLTGDNRCAAARLGDELGMEVRAELLPDQKVAAVRARAERVLVVGDGVNDAPAMAAAHVSIAMGRSGSDVTLQTADAITVRDDLATIPAALALARRARRVVFANLVIAASFIAVLVVWDLFWHLPLPLGVAGHEGSTVIVALNGLRLLRDRAWFMAVRQSRGGAESRCRA